MKTVHDVETMLGFTIIPFLNNRVLDQIDYNAEIIYLPWFHPKLTVARKIHQVIVSEHVMGAMAK